MKHAFFAAAALALVSSAALATVTFDSSTGTGFVGKGDVQIAFGWNNKAAQDNAKAVAFSLETDDMYDVTCEWDTTTGHGLIHHGVTNHKHQGVNASVAYDARMKNQYTGYTLSGFTGTPTITGQAAPSVGDSCPEGAGTARVTAVELTSSVGGLFVTYNNNSVQLTI
jgi:hypothetical protein